jgi:hypothetical protein
MPHDTLWGWAVTMLNEGTTTQPFAVIATCALIA